MKHKEREGQPVRKALDTKVIPSPDFKIGTGYSKRHAIIGTKISLEVEERGGIDRAVLSKGNIHDQTLAEPTILDSLSNGTKRASSLAADKGYDSSKFRHWLRAKKIKRAIPERIYGNRKRRRGKPFGYKQEYWEVRYVIERTNGRLEGFRRIKFRYERKFSNFTGVILLAAILINVRL